MAPSTALKPLPPHSTNVKEPLSQSLLLIPTKSLEIDETIRKKLHEAHFLISRQILIILSPQESDDFVYLISNPSSRMYVDAPDLIKEEPSVSDKAIQLAKGPVLVLLIEKEGNCIEKVLAFIQELNTSLRDASIYCTEETITLNKEIDFFFNRSQIATTAIDLSHKPFRKARVHLDVVMRCFFFPSHLTHPDALGRVLVFGMYGPLDNHSRLTGGSLGLHVLSDREIQAMATQIQCEDVYKVYNLCNLSPEELCQVQNDIQKLISIEKKYTESMILKLFHSCRRDEDGTLTFEDMQSVILSERAKRVLRLKSHITSSNPSSILSGKWRERRKRSEKCLSFDECKGLTNAQIASLVSQLLSKHSHEICHLQDGNASALTQNVKLLRSQ
uniref:Aspartyl protease family A01A putative n=1 Tax=Albugo laibachii Nc14 TaxID=890382 RepID=F0WDE7_9STRA|nr:aspartyl protease family A01A putative [Albugo laibachii Nc14]|eukprot:CCA19219.1 aspartyl protease family A01A putative [Albugo laibachii Nc14]